MNQGIAIDMDRPIQIAAESGLMNSLCTIQKPTNTDSNAGWDVGGAPTGDYEPVAGMIDIQAMDAPLSMGSPPAGEDKSEAQQLNIQTRHILLVGYYPEIPDNGSWQAVITNPAGEVEVYDIVGADADSQATQTRINGRNVTP